MEGALIVYGFVMSIFVLSVSIPRIITYFKWLSWKKKAKLAIFNMQTAKCHFCKDNIFPGQRVIQIDKDKLVHVGYHFSLKSRYKICALFHYGQQGLGTWDGHQFLPAD